MRFVKLLTRYIKKDKGITILHRIKYTKFDCIYDVFVHQKIKTVNSKESSI